MASQLASGRYSPLRGTVQAAYDTLLAEFDVDPERLRVRSGGASFQELLKFGLVEQKG